MPKASIIIPTYNSSKRIEETLTGVRNLKTDIEFEVIVVNDGSTDDTQEIVNTFTEFTLINQENSGPGVARNQGAKEAVGEILLFIDDDCIPEPDWLDKMLKPFEDEEISAAKGAYLSRQQEAIARFVQIEYEEKYALLSSHKYIDFIDTYSAAFRKSVFDESGGYDAEFTTASVEDQEFSFRLASKGHKMVFIEEAKVWHRHVDSLSGYFKKKLKIGFWKVLALKKNPEKTGGDSHTPLSLKLQILLTPILMISLLALLFGAGFRPFFLLLSLFLATTANLTTRVIVRDAVIAPLAPLYIFTRAVGLTLGLAKGVLNNFRK